MHAHLIRAALLPALFLVAIAAGCGKDKPSFAGLPCASSRDCPDGLLCKRDRCHMPCAASTQCQPGQRCGVITGTNVCILDETTPPASTPPVTPPPATMTPAPGAAPGVCGASGTPCCGGTMCTPGLLCTPAAAHCTCARACAGSFVLRGDGAVVWNGNNRLKDISGQLFVAADARDIAGSIRKSYGVPSACVVRADGTVWCWGSNDSGQLGAGLTVGASEAPVQVVTSSRAPLSGATRVSTNETGTTFCALGEGGRVWCWGEGTGGHLGNGFEASSAVAVPVVLVSGGEPLSGAIDVSVGLVACAARSDGSVWCWGGREGALPRLVNLLEPATSVACRSDHCCATGMKAGNLWCWGMYRAIPTKLAYKDQRLVEGVTRLTQGPAGLAAQLADQTVLTWDYNYDPAPALIDKIAVTAPLHLGEQCFLSGQSRHSDGGPSWVPFCD